ncbi:MAG TPA: carbon-nitrogen hydrolase family protein [Patescibacteria group bacterium]|nr:carbon-nitrogen hydrolase family protein [Patescibacteria group bacterium]
MHVKIAVVQTRTFVGEDEEKNVSRALKYIDQAVEKTAQVICFPETYPGPWRAPISFSPIEALCDKAKEEKVYVIAGTIEKVETGQKGCYNVAVLIGPEGKVLGKYRRTTPAGPWGYKSGNHWDFDYVEADELPVFETQFGKIGILICSEVYVPELSRILALKGAEILFLPTGLTNKQQWATWRTLIHARAIENLMYTATCRNILGVEPYTHGLAMISSPEEVLLESRRVGVFVEDLDMDRIRLLRRTRDIDIPKDKRAWKTKVGLLRYWRRPEMYKKALSSW